MNYFGHAAVASWSTASPAARLGSMLPDFANMCRAHLEPAQTAEVAAGISLHHATDAAFHDLPPVTALMRELDDRLQHGGCARGPRRAVAHVGVELLLDGVLVDDAAYRDAYTSAISADTPVAWTGDGNARFAMLTSRLRTYGVPDDLRSVDGIVARLARILAPRPLLAPSSDDLRVIAVSLRAQQGRVGVAAETVMRGLKAIVGSKGE